jgi:tetratricopeptide (TPR) repeat protein
MAVALSGLFNVYYGSGRMEEAAAVNRRAAEIREKIAREHSDVPHFQDVLTQTRHNRALQSASAADQGIAEVAKTIEAHRSLVRDHPDVVKFRRSLASDYNLLGGLSHRAGRYAKAESAFREAIAEWRELVRREPQIPHLKLLGEAAAAEWLRPPTAIVAHMKNDSDLNPIRSRKDYQELIKRIEAQAIGKGNDRK